MNASDTNPYRYCGEYYYFESGTIYLRARYYSPTHGRFTQVDTARDGFNLYAYCYNNPVAFVDPSGEIAVAAVSIFAVIDVVSGAVIATAVTAAAAAAIAATCDFITKIVETGKTSNTKVDTATNNKNAVTESDEKSNNESDAKGKKQDGNEKKQDKDSRLKGAPGDINKEGYKETKIGDDGNATKERHNSDHGNPKKHTNPHDHKIKWIDGKPSFGPPINYPNGAPPFN